LTDIPLEGVAGALKRLGRTGGISGKAVPAGPTASSFKGVPPAPSVSVSLGAVGRGRVAEIVTVPGPVVLAMPLQPPEPASPFALSPASGKVRKARPAWLAALEQIVGELRGGLGR